MTIFARAISSPILAHAGHGDHMSGSGWGWGGGWMWIWGAIMMAVLVAAVIVGLLWAVRSARSRAGGSDNRARQILDERFARGELDTEEYNSRVRELP